MEMPKRSKSSSRCTESESEVLKSKGESMKMMTPLRGFDLLHRGLRDSWRSIAMAWAVCLSVSMLGGCGVIPPNVLTTPGNPVPVAKVFPSALLAEPIQLRAGYTHTSQPFQLKNPAERWIVALGFVRSDTGRSAEEKMDEAYDVCWVRGPGKGLGYTSCSKSLSSGYELRWELLNEYEIVVAHFLFDSARQDGAGTYASDAITRTLSGFGDQKVGLYRLRVTVLRDAKELDFLKPHILVNRPFFSSRSIE